MNETLPEMMKYYNAHGPFAVRINFNTIPKERLKALENALLSDEFKNLVQMNLLIKSGVLQSYQVKKEDSELIFEVLKKELED